MKKFFLRFPNGFEIHYETSPHEPMELERFYVLAGLAAFVVLAVVMLLWEVWR